MKLNMLTTDDNLLGTENTNKKKKLHKDFINYSSISNMIRYESSLNLSNSELEQKPLTDRRSSRIEIEEKVKLEKEKIYIPPLKINDPIILKLEGSTIPRNDYNYLEEKEVILRFKNKSSLNL